VKFVSKHKRAVSMLFAFAMVFAMAIPAFATGESGGDSAAITSAVSTGLQGVQTQAMSLIATILPYALAIMGAVLVVMIGIRVFKSVAKK